MWRDAYSNSKCANGRRSITQHSLRACARSTPTARGLRAVDQIQIKTASFYVFLIYNLQLFLLLGYREQLFLLIICFITAKNEAETSTAPIDSEIVIVPLEHHSPALLPKSDEDFGDEPIVDTGYFSGPFSFNPFGNLFESIECRYKVLILSNYLIRSFLMSNY